MARGRNARSPAEMPRRGWLDILWRTWTGLMEERIGLIAAGVAFYSLLALFPAIAAAVALAGLIVDPAWVVTRFEGLSQVLPAEATEIIIGQAQKVAASEETELGLAALISLAIAFYSATRGASSLIQGLNAANGEIEKRGIVRLFALRILFTLFLIAGVLVAAVLSVAVPALLGYLGFAPSTERLITGISWAVLMVFAMLGLAFIYRYGPSRARARWRWITPGACTAIILWGGGTMAFGYYVSNIARYNETFGTLGGVVVLLMWLWLSAFIVLLGAKLDAEIEAQTRIDSTTGPPRPMGERGAVKADTLGQSWK